MSLPITWEPTEPPLDAALRFTLWSEGDLSDDPADHGGLTKWGITQASYSAWRFTRKLPPQSVSLMTRAEMTSIYDDSYWRAGACDKMPPMLAIAHFDWCVNHGPNGAKRTLQAVLGVTQDGVIGNGTLTAIAAQDIEELVRAYVEARKAWYRQDAQTDPTQDRFLDGWLNRCANLKDYLGV